jgi:serine/threonine-protein kinase
MDTIGEYRLIAPLGHGGMARVYLALSAKSGGLDKPLVLKVMRDDLGAESRRMFMDEARLAARVAHPNVVQTYEVGESGGQHFIVMEYLEGLSLSGLLDAATREAFPLDVHLRILCDALEGLHHAHELRDYDESPLRIVHRDVSPHNVFVTTSGISKLLDFGVAKVGDATKAEGGGIKGKVTYMAPEQASGKTADRRADIFAVGVMLWEALARRRLVSRSEDETATLERRMLGKDPRIREAAPDAPEALIAVCERAMSFAIEDRYSTALDMQAAILAYLAPAPVDARDVARFLDLHHAENARALRRRIDESMKRKAAPDGSAPHSPSVELLTDASVTQPRGQDDGTRTLAAIPVSSTSALEAPPQQRRRWLLYGTSAALGLALIATLVVRGGVLPGGTRDADLSCVGNVQWEPPDARTTLHSRALFLTLVGDRAVEGVDIKACAQRDPLCLNPIDHSQTNARGFVELALPKGFTGYVEASANAAHPDMVPLLVFAPPPVADSPPEAVFERSRDRAARLVMNESEISSILSIIGQKLDPARGQFVGIALDCKRHPLDGVSLVTNVSDPRSTPFYTDIAGIPSSRKTATGRRGEAGILNLPPGVVDIEAVRTVNGTRTRIGSYTVVIRAGAVTQLGMVPTP